MQPKYSVARDKIDSAEALVRWFDPATGEYRFPAAFISLFETNGFIVKIDQFLYLEVLKYLNQATQRGDKIVPISLNVSRVTALSPDFIDFYIGNKKKYQIGDNFLTLELTESFAMENYEKLREIIKALHENGIRCSIDDFGSGYSSLNMLSSMPIDVLKMDMAFIRNIERNERDFRLVELIIDIARYLKVPVVAEGVETENQLRLLRNAGCDLVQGYYFSPPLCAAEFEEKC